MRARRRDASAAGVSWPFILMFSLGFLALAFVGAQQDRPGAAAALAKGGAPLPPSGNVQKFLTPAYEPNRGMGRKSDREIVSSADLIIIQTRMAGRVAGLRAAAAAMGKPVKILLYELPQHPGRWMSFFADVDAHEDWWLHNPDTDMTKGARVRQGDRAGVLDFRKPEVRNFIINHVMTKWIVPYGLDGYWNDGPSPSLRRLPWIQGPTTAQVDTWPAGIAAFATEMRAALGGRLFGWNNLIHRHGLSVNPDLASPAIDTVRAKTDLHMIEFAYHAGFQCIDQSMSEAEIEEQFARTQALTLEEGKHFQAYSGTSWSLYDPSSRGCHGRRGTSEEVDRLRDFTFAAYLMQATGGDYYTWYLHGPVDHASLQSLQIGMPLGPREKANGVWVREFTRSTVKVNLSPTQTRDGIPPQRGVFLLK